MPSSDGAGEDNLEKEKDGEIPLTPEPPVDDDKDLGGGDSLLKEEDGEVDFDFEDDVTEPSNLEGKSSEKESLDKNDELESEKDGEIPLIPKPPVNSNMEKLFDLLISKFFRLKVLFEK